jgi:hypothetical protein
MAYRPLFDLSAAGWKAGQPCPRTCDAGVTQNLPRLPKLTLLTTGGFVDSISYVFAGATRSIRLIWSGCHTLFLFPVSWPQFSNGTKDFRAPHEYRLNQEHTFVSA